MEAYQEAGGVEDVGASADVGDGEGLDRDGAAVGGDEFQGGVQIVDADHGDGARLAVAGRHQAGVDARRRTVRCDQVVRRRERLELPAEDLAEEHIGRLEVGAVELDVADRPAHRPSPGVRRSGGAFS